MNTIGFNPDNWLDVATIISVALIAAVPSIYAAKAHKGINAVREQVQNGHTQTNLRDDLDRAIKAIEDLAHDVRALKSDLLIESDHRRLQISDLKDELDHRRHRPL